MIQQTQDQWMDSQYIASSYEGGLAFPNYRSLAESFSLEYYEASSTGEMVDLLEKTDDKQTAALFNIHVASGMRVVPQVKAGYPNEDLEPLLPRDMFKDQMIVKPFSAL